MSIRLACFAVCTLGVVATTTPALAHISLDYPPMRGGDQKMGPCEGLPKGEPTVLSPGQTITVSWHETIGHDSHYRIALDTDGEDDLVEPTGYDDRNSGPAVIMDSIPDKPGKASYTYNLTLPNVECETCTLQVIQVMYDKPPFDGDDVYHRCADIALRGEPAPDAMPGTGADAMPGTGADAMPGGSADAMPTGGADAMATGGGGDDGGCQIAAGNTGSAAAMWLLALGVVGFALRKKTAPSDNR